MISLDQVILLEQKVESAVAKIQQLKTENDALRRKCLELTNALSAKSEQLSSFENDQSQIENGIKKALNRLNSIENSVIHADMLNQNKADKPVEAIQPVQQIKTTTESFQDLKPVKRQAEIPAAVSIPENSQETEFALESEVQVSEQPEETQIDNAFNNEMFQQPEESEYEDDSEDQPNQTNFGFDIF